MTTISTIPAWIDDMDESDYHADPCDTPSLSSSIANVLLTRSPWHAWREHPKLGRQCRAASAEQDFGAIVHALVLGRGAKFFVIEAANYRAKAWQRARDEMLAIGCIPILRPRYDEALAVANGIRAEMARYGLHLDGTSERVAVWEERVRSGPVLCRARMDHVCKDGTILDVKTTSDAVDSALVRSCVRYGYHVQSAAYLSAARALDPGNAGRTRFVFVFVESSTGMVVPKVLSGELASIGENRWQRAVDAWGRCLQTGEWPGLANGIGRLEAPDWVVVSDMDDADRLRERMTPTKANGGING